MAKLKEYPKIAIELFKDILNGKSDLVESKLKNAYISIIDKVLPDNSYIRYAIWRHNHSKIIQKNKTLNQDVKFAILYFFNEKFDQKLYKKFEKSLKNQNYTNFKIFIDQENIIEEIINSGFTHISFVEQGDFINNSALSSVAQLINKNPDIQTIYTDEDELSPFKIRINPYFKTDYARLLLYSHNYMNAFLVLSLKQNSTQLIKSLKKISQDTIYKLVLDLAKDNAKIEHISDILYHRDWKNLKKIRNLSSKPIIANEIQQQNLNASIIDYKIKGLNIIKFYPANNPKVSIIIPFKDKLDYLKKCINSIETKSIYDNYEIILVNNRSSEDKTLNYLKKNSHKVLNADIDFNFSKLNNMGAKEAKGDYLILLNNDTEIISDDWIETLIGIAQLKTVGAVSGKLLYPNNKLQNVGITTKARGVNHVNQLQHCDSNGYRNYNHITREYSLLTGACIAISKEKYFEVGGLTESLAVEWNDMDFCLKLKAAGYTNIFNPHSVLYHYEKISRGKKYNDSRSQESQYFNEIWGELLPKDPYSNKNFNGKKSGFAIKIQ